MCRGGREGGEEKDRAEEIVEEKGKVEEMKIKEEKGMKEEKREKEMVK